MKIHRVHIPKCKLDDMGRAEAVFFVRLAHMLNELNILQKCLVVSSDGASTDDYVERRSQVCQAMFFLRTLAGKLIAGWEMLESDFFGSQLSKRFEKKFSERGADALSRLKRYLPKDSIVRTIRNKFAAHYGKEIDIEKAIEQTPYGERLEMFISEYRGNSLYSFADVILNWDILQSIASSDPQQAMKTLAKEVTEVSGWFQAFGDECLFIIGKEANLAREEIEIAQPPALSDVKLPYFVEKSR